MHGTGPAGPVAAANGALLGVAGAGVVSLASGIFAALDDIRDARYTQAYDNALAKAIAHARQMDVAFETALEVVAELRAENAALRRACEQRQGVIERMRARTAA